ncbi:MAG: TIGR04282 family arsenosugar biosynthesis glycosyltransferase [Desulfobacteraceae bacterium]|nr:TIGR04282 family arsenosugar biosynthesis glycosyltransferase [Desulfobacteraceae bacterium]
MTESHDFLLIFLRYPRPGKVKSRLASAIGAEEAARIYEKLVRRTLGVALEYLRTSPKTRILLFHTPEDPVELLRERFPGPWQFLPQQGEHLGARMHDAILSAFAQGARKVVLIGTDIADLDANDLTEAFEKTGGGAVLGPASDGGFYLVGLDRPCPLPFRYEHWGSGDICRRTARALSSSGLDIRFGHQRKDVDRVEDLAVFHRDFSLRASLGTIVPTMKSPEALAPLIEYLEKRLWPGDEIIVSQGGSRSYRWNSLSTGVHHLLGPTGRGIQQNSAAMLASADVLFFLHDDTFPPPNFPFLIRRACGDFKTSLGCFRLSFAPSPFPLRLVAGLANLRTTLFGLPYGDQGLFCRKSVFESLGGFRNKYLLEDLSLVRKCRLRGRLDMLRESVLSSSRRYIDKGVLAACLQNQTIILLSALGMDEKRLYSFYYGKSPEQGANGHPAS